MWFIDEVRVQIKGVAHSSLGVDRGVCFVRSWHGSIAALRLAYVAQTSQGWIENQCLQL